MESSETVYHRDGGSGGASHPAATWQPIAGRGVLIALATAVAATATTAGREYLPLYMAALGGVIAAWGGLATVVRTVTRRRDGPRFSGWLPMGAALTLGAMGLVLQGAVARWLYAIVLLVALLPGRRVYRAAAAAIGGVLIPRLKASPDGLYRRLAELDVPIDLLSVIVIVAGIIAGWKRFPAFVPVFSRKKFAAALAKWRTLPAYPAEELLKRIPVALLAAWLAWVPAFAFRIHTADPRSSAVVDPRTSAIATLLANPVPGMGGRPSFYDLHLTPDGSEAWFSFKTAPLLGRTRLDTDPPQTEVHVIGTQGRMIQRFALAPTEPPAAVHDLGVTTMEGGNVTTVECATGFNNIGFGLAHGPGWAVAMGEYRFGTRIWSPDNCEQRQTFRVPVVMPYGVICTTGRCYVDGWFFSGTLAELWLSRTAPSVIGVRPVSIGPFSTGMAADETRSLLYVARPLAATVDVIDTQSLTLEKRIPTIPMIRALDVAPEHALLFVAEYTWLGGGRIQIHDSLSGESLGVFEAGATGDGEIRSVVWSAARQELWWTSRKTIRRMPLSALAEITGRSPGPTRPALP